ncbi:MAG: TlpA family protein disulfide reductase [Planctomycetes bacterium]|nr:TlpA family protein disulfide reductase [Planctomycetota bacterium]
MPALVEKWDKFKDRPFQLLAITDESASQIEKFIPSKGITYPTAAGGASRSFRSWGVRGRPSAYLIDHEGVVIWQGHPARLSHAQIEEAIARAESDGPWDPGERHEVLKRAVKSAQEGKLGVAWKAAESARKRAMEDAVATAAIDVFQADIVERGGRVIDKAAKMTAEGRYFQAVEYLEGKIVVFKGAPLEKEWKGVIKEWMSSKDGKAQYDLDKKRRSALAAARKGDMEKAIKDLRKLSEKAEGLPIAAVIGADYQALREVK